MKVTIPQTPHKAGFTLIELLVVIAIIATLATLGFTAGRGAILKAKVMKSTAQATDIANAVESFYQDYSVYPSGVGIGGNAGVNLSVNASDDSEATDGGGIIQVLLAAEAAATPVNLRNISYLDGHPANAAGNDGIVEPGFSFNDWQGRPYEVIWDANYDGKLDDPLGGANQIRFGVVVGNQGKSDVALNAAPKEHEIVKTW